MKTIILFLSFVLSSSAATLYPVLTDNSGRTFSGGATNLALLNATNQTFVGTNTFNTNTILGTAKLQDTLDGKPTVALTNVAQLNQSQTFTGPNTFGVLKILYGTSAASSYAARTNFLSLNRSDFATQYGHRITASMSAVTTDSTLALEVGSGASSFVTPLVVNGAGTVFIGGTNAGTSPALQVAASGNIGISGNFGAGETSPTDRLVVKEGMARIISGITGDGSSWANRSTAITFNRTNVATTYGGKVTFSAHATPSLSTINLEPPSGSSTTTNALTATGEGHVGIGVTAPLARFHVAGGPIAMSAISTPSPVSGAGLIYTKTSGTTEVWVMDSGGTETQISPHSANGPAWLYDQTPGLEHVVESRQHYLGRVVLINLERAAVLAAMTDAQKSALPAKRLVTRHEETFAEYNERMGLTGSNAISVREWDVDVEAARTGRGSAFVRPTKPRFIK